MSQVTDEVEGAIARLELFGTVRRLTDAEAQQLNHEIRAAFVIGGDRRWWWEAFREPIASKVFDDGGFRHLEKLVPDKDEQCWFVVEDDDGPCYPVWESSPVDAAAVIGECFAFEYYIVSKAKRWLICENHHNLVIGVGEDVVRSIREIRVTGGE